MTWEGLCVRPYVVVVASCAGSLAVGAPTWMLPAAAAAAWGLARFHASRSLGDYSLFVCGEASHFVFNGFMGILTK